MGDRRRRRWEDRRRRVFRRRGWVVKEEIGGENRGDGLLKRRYEVEEVRR